MAREPARSTQAGWLARGATLLDASALLALLQNETGADIVSDALPSASISAANLPEVIAKLVQKGVPGKRAVAAVFAFDLDIVPVDEATALEAGPLAKDGKALGLSLGIGSVLRRVRSTICRS